MADEDDDLIEFKSVKEFDKLHDLLVVFELDIVLLESMQSKLGIRVNVELEWLLHEKLASTLDVVIEGS